MVVNKITIFMCVYGVCLCLCVRSSRTGEMYVCMNALGFELSVSHVRHVLYHWVISPALKASFNNLLIQNHLLAAYFVW